MEINHAWTRWNKLSKQKYFQRNNSVKENRVSTLQSEFHRTVLFESKGEETQIDWTMLFDTAEMRDIVIKAHGAEEDKNKTLKDLENIFLICRVKKISI